MTADTLAAAVPLLALLAGAALVLYVGAWRWLAGAPERMPLLIDWLIAHGLTLISLLALKYLTPLGSDAAFRSTPLGVSPLSFIDLGQRFGPLVPIVFALAILLDGVFLWLLVVALVDGLRRTLLQRRTTDVEVFEDRLIDAG